MHVEDYESSFYRILADNFSPDDNLPVFPATSHATPREWQMHERIANGDQPTDRSHGVITDPAHLLPTQGWIGPSVARLETHAASLDGSWVSPHTGRRYMPGDHVSPADLGYHNHQNATWEHDGNPSPRETSGNYDAYQEKHTPFHMRHTYRPGSTRRDNQE